MQSVLWSEMNRHEHSQSKPPSLESAKRRPIVSVQNQANHANRARNIWPGRCTLALEDAGLTLKDFNGQGLGVTIPTAYPQPFWPEEVAEILGITPGFLLGGATGGAGAVSLLGGMAAAINSGLIDIALCVGAAAPFPNTSAAVFSPATCAIGKFPTAPWDPTAKSPWSCAAICTSTALLSIISARLPSQAVIMRA